MVLRSFKELLFNEGLSRKKNLDAEKEVHMENFKMMWTWVHKEEMIPIYWKLMVSEVIYRELIFFVRSYIICFLLQTNFHSTVSKNVITWAGKNIVHSLYLRLREVWGRILNLNKQMYLRSWCMGPHTGNLYKFLRTKAKHGALLIQLSFVCKSGLV